MNNGVLIFKPVQGSENFNRLKIQMKTFSFGGELPSGTPVPLWHPNKIPEFFRGFHVKSKNCFFEESNVRPP